MSSILEQSGAAVEERRRSPVVHSGTFLFVLILLLAFLLRSYGLGSQSVWIDEAYSLRLAGLSPAGILDETARENHPPIYFFLLSAWMHLGPESEVWARSLSVLLGVVLVWIFFRFCRRLAPDPIPHVATALLAISPMAVWHSQDARMYPLALVFSFSALLVLVQYLEKPTPGKAVLFGTAVVAALFTHLYTMFLVPISLIALGLYRRRLRPAQIGWMTAATLFAAACWLPWIWVIFRVHHTAGFFKPVSIFSIPYALYAFSVGYSLGPSIAEMRPLVGHAGFPLQYLPVVAVTGMVFGAPLLVGLWNARRYLTRCTALVVVLFVVPLVSPVLVSLMSSGQIDFNARYAFLAFPAYLLLVAVGLVSARPLAVQVLLSAGILVLSVASLEQHFTNPRYAKEDARSAYRWVESHRGEQDCVLVLGVTEAFQYYEKVPPTSRWLDFRYSERMSETEDTLEKWAKDCPKLWFVLGRQWEGDPLGMAVPTLDKFFKPIEKVDMPGVVVVTMEPRNRTSLTGGSPDAPQGP